MNLFKVEHLYCFSNDIGAKFHMANRLWKTINKISEGEDQTYGITILAKYCVDYLNGEIHVDLDKLDKAIKDTVSRECTDFFTSEDKILKNLELKLITLDPKYSIFITSNNNDKNYLLNSGCKDAEIINANEYLIKKLL